MCKKFLVLENIKRTVDSDTECETDFDTDFDTDAESDSDSDLSNEEQTSNTDQHLFGMESVIICTDADLHATENEKYIFTIPEKPLEQKPDAKKKRKLYTPGSELYKSPGVNKCTPIKNDQEEKFENTIPILKVPDWVKKLTLFEKIDEICKTSEVLKPSAKKQTPNTVKTNQIIAGGNTIKKNNRNNDNKIVHYDFLQSLDLSLQDQYCHPEALKYRTHFPKHKFELAEKLFDLFNKRLFKFDNNVSIPISWNKKLTNTAGRCCTKKRHEIRTCRLELSDKVITNCDRLRMTLAHEMCHAATWIKEGYNGHGNQWKKWTKTFKTVFPDLPEINVCHAYAIEYKYTYKCVQCSSRSQAHSKSKKTDQIRCAYCKGNIEIFLNKKSPNGSVYLAPLKEPSKFAKYVQDNFKRVKESNKIQSHKEVMQMLSTEFKTLNVNI